MEPKLRRNLLKLFGEYHNQIGGALSTLSAKVANDARFYHKLAGGLCLFTVQRYDLVVASFADIWPADLPWPDDIERFTLDAVQPRPRKKRTKVASEA